MGLTQYKRKRKFSKTPEPAGSVRRARAAAAGAAPGGRRFVVQKHDASRLHYDFRLELDGVLKSWAVPKAPSFDPKDKRLAVHVEDHPLEYGTFEGTIPQGQYGGGTVMVWDTGTWTPVGDAREDYRAGKLKFTLNGERLRGRWMLVRTRMLGKGKEQWLLFKERDEEVKPGVTADAINTSVQSGRTMEEIAAGNPPKRVRAPQVAARPASSAAGGRGQRKKPAPMPESLRPQLATLAQRPPSGDEWLHEIKFDGYRLIAFKHGESVRLLSRNGKDWSAKLPELCRTIADRLRVDAVIDGEAVMLDTRGISDFQALQNAIHGRRSASIVFFVFDLPWADGEDLMGMPLQRRRERLAELIGRRQEGRLRFSEHVEGDGVRAFRAAASQGVEGIVSKLRRAVYTPGRSTSWLKIKTENRQEFVIGGYTPPEGTRQEFGALLVGYYEGEKLRYAGRVGTGFSNETLKRMGAELRTRIVQKCPFTPPPGTAEARSAAWVKPELVCEVRFLEWTEDGIMRHPSFQGLRQDKPAREVKREAAIEGVGGAEAMKGTKARAGRTIGKRSAGRARTKPDTRASDGSAASSGITLTNPDRVVYPDRGAGYSLTKRQVAEYYEAVAEHMLPHVAGRALSIVRCPDGEGGGQFFQKHIMKGMPKAIGSVQIEEAEGDREQYLMINDRAGLLGLVQMNALEIHPWGSRADQPDKPDRLIFDFDPGPGVPWKEVIEGAKLMRDALKDVGLTPFARTSGGKGLHVLVPIERRATWEQAKAFCKAVAETFVKMSPRRFVSTAAKERREGRVYIDYLRNTRGATAIGSYSTRARPGAPVATPLAWDEVVRDLEPRSLNAVSVPRRLESGRDPWAGLDKAAARLPVGAALRR